MTVQPVPGYTYKLVELLKVLDGDTVDCRINLGFGLNAVMRFRIMSVDTPETREAGWAEAKETTRAWLTTRTGVLVHTYKSSQGSVGIGDGAFGRWMADFEHDGQRLSTLLRDKGWGV